MAAHRFPENSTLTYVDTMARRNAAAKAAYSLQGGVDCHRW
jgi:hypothetical protein